MIDVEHSDRVLVLIYSLIILLIVLDLEHLFQFFLLDEYVTLEFDVHWKIFEDDEHEFHRLSIDYEKVQVMLIEIDELDLDRAELLSFRFNIKEHINR